MNAPAHLRSQPEAESRPSPKLREPFQGINSFWRRFSFQNWSELEPRVLILEEEDGRTEWISIRDEHPALAERLPSLNPMKW